MITGYVIGDDKVIAKFNRIFSTTRDRLRDTMNRLGFKLQAHIKEDKLSGQVLGKYLHGKATNRLRASINVASLWGDANTIGVQVGTNVEYAAIHEYGGRTAPHIIRPRNKKCLAFTMGGKNICAAYVNHPGSQMPERSFLRSALKDMEGEIKSSIESAVRQGIADA